jgi:hypothetical protein
MSKAKIGAAVLCGYVLGRTKKAKLALSLGAMLAGSRMRPGQLGKVLEESPFVGNISREVRTELAHAGKAAATTVLTAKADDLADAIHERTAGLQEKAHVKGVPGRDETDRGDEGEDRADENLADKNLADKNVADKEERGEGRRSRERRGEGREKRAQHRGPGAGQGSESRRRREPAGRSGSRRSDDG